jgi:aryl-alcohol dehydrogenase-like predicted oxidoreductase
MKMNRREFLGTAVAGAAGVWTAGSAAFGATVNSTPTAAVPLGKAFEACRVSCGTGMRGGNRETNQTRMGKEKFEALLNYAYDNGIRQFDMADMYGTHPYVGRVMKSKPRDKVQLVSKIWTRPKGLPEKERPLADVLIKRFLKELQTDYIDLVQIHCMVESDWTVTERAQMDALEELKQKGLIRAHGVSCHSLDALKTAAEEPWVDVVHARINPFGKSTDGTSEELVPVLKKIHAAGKGIIGMKLAGAGTFDAHQRKESLNWVMGLGCIDCLTVGFEKPAEIDEFLANVREGLTVGV